MFSVFEKLSSCFLNSLFHVIFLPAMCEWSSFCASGQLLLLSLLFILAFPDRCVATRHDGFIYISLIIG